MHLAEAKANLQMSWSEIAEIVGVNRANLAKMARGERGWDVATGGLLKSRLGIDLNEQTDIFLLRQKELAQEAVKRPASKRKRTR